MAASYYPADAWGGVPVDGGDAPGSALAPSTAHLVAGPVFNEPPEEPDPRFCRATSAKTNAQCRAYPRKGGRFCIYHEDRDVDGGADTG